MKSIIKKLKKDRINLTKYKGSVYANKITKYEVELNKWKNEIDPEPTKAEKRVKFRQKLNKRLINLIEKMYLKRKAAFQEMMVNLLAFDIKNKLFKKN